VGLRINSNLPALIGQRQLRATDLENRTTLERLSTGRRLNRTSDDPHAMVLADRMKGRLVALQTADENSLKAANLAGTADAALTEVLSLLSEIRRSLLFAMDGSAGPDQVAAEQQYVDDAVESIRRIARTSRYGDVRLFDGSAGFQTTHLPASGVLEVRPFTMRFNPAPSW
jgi:flagellin